jgi:hypothetical protein
VAQMAILKETNDVKVILSSSGPGISTDIKSQALDAGTLAFAKSDDKTTIAKYVAAKMNSF